MGKAGPPNRGGRGTRRPSRRRTMLKTRGKKKDPIFVDGKRPRPMYVDYKDLDLLKKLTNRQGKIIGRRKSGCTAASLLAVTAAVKRARFMALLPPLNALAPPNIEEHARALGNVFMEALLEPQAAKTIQVILAEIQHLPEVKRLYQEEALPRANAQVAGFFKAQMDRGTFRGLDPSIATRSLFGMFFIFVLTQEIFGASRVTPMSSEEIVDTVMGIFFHGILTRGAAS